MRLTSSLQAYCGGKEYGGQGFSVMRQVVLREQLAYHRAPLINPNGLSMLAPILMLHGTEEQKRRHLPGIANCEVQWCQGYSEPNAGSDLASLQTRAVRDGDEYVINGQKIWTSHAHLAAPAEAEPSPLLAARPSHRCASILTPRGASRKSKGIAPVMALY